MGGILGFAPLQHNKQRLTGSWTSTPTNRGATGDVEKSDFDEESGDDEYSATSSASTRSTSASLDGMLATGHKSRREVNAYRIPRRRCNRYFTLVLVAIIVSFVLFLTQAHISSNRFVASRTSFFHSNKQAPWEEFPFLKRYHGGIRTLVRREDNEPEYPGDPEEIVRKLQEIANPPDPEKENAVVRRQEETQPTYSIPPSRPFDPFNQSSGSMARRECFLDKAGTIRTPKLRVFDGVPRGFPDNVVGSYDIFGLNQDVCFDRFGRLGPYGFGYSQKMGGTGAGMEGDREGAELVWEQDLEVDFATVNWHDAQSRCYESNKHRFNLREKGRNHRFQEMIPGQNPEDKSDKQVKTTKLSSSVVLIRTWYDFQYSPEDIMYLRALISELSLASGSEVTIHFLIHVKDDNLQIWSDEETHRRVLHDSLPPEFRGMGTLWSERQMSLIYGGTPDSNYRDMPVHGNYRSTFMPVQYFAHQHPEFDFFWNWEMDTRYTGHYYHLFEKVGAWAKAQPRKGLWERNGRFYLPSRHGSWEEFSQMVRVQVQHGTNSKSNVWSRIGPKPDLDPKTSDDAAEKPIWGPEPPLYDNIDLEDAPHPPTTYDKDKYEWGVGEEADLITFNPLFNPDKTGWILAEDVTGYNLTGGYPPRRTAIVTNSRLSRRLLETMHRETSLHRHTMFSEMWPASCALHHGLKAVYAPHPVFVDRMWPTDYMAAVFNGGRNGATGGAPTSPFNDFRQHNFLGVTWYYHAGFPANLWKRWLGYRVDGDGGEEHEMANEGRMCLPAMLLHPVKHVDMIFEHEEELPAEE